MDRIIYEMIKKSYDREKIPVIDGTESLISLLGQGVIVSLKSPIPGFDIMDLAKSSPISEKQPFYIFAASPRVGVTCNLKFFLQASTEPDLAPNFFTPAQAANFIKNNFASMRDSAAEEIYVMFRLEKDDKSRELVLQIQRPGVDNICTIFDLADDSRDWNISSRTRSILIKTKNNYDSTIIM